MTPRVLAWGNKVSQQFVDRVLKMCNDFGWSDEHANWLMACMAFETGESFRPDIKNFAGSGATGLIQFMPKTAIDLGTTTDALSRMSAEQQLDYVQKYFKPYYHRIHSLSDMYMAILLPKYVGRSEDEVLFQGTGASYRQNAGLDANKDGRVTKKEASAKVQAKLDKGMDPKYARFL